MRALLIVALASFVAASPQARSQAGAPVSPATEFDPPPALAALRARYAESLVSADRSATGQWAASLVALEKSRAAAADYAGAERVKNRREEALAVAGADDGRVPVRLTASDLARKGSGLKEDGSTGTITMSSNGAFIEWEVSGDFKGTYEVRLNHAVGGKKDRTGEITPGAGPPGSDRHLKKSTSDDAGARSGLLSFQNVSNLKVGEAVILRRETVSTGGSYAWVTVSMGRMEIPGRIAKFRLTLDESGSEPLRFRGLELVPVPPATVAGDGTTKLAKVMEVFSKEFRNQTQMSNNHYRESLTLLEQQAQRAKVADTDAVVRLRNEKARLAAAPEQLALGEVSESRSGTGPVVLDVVASSASFKFFYRGDIIPDSTRTSLTKLRPANAASITWQLAACNVRSGVYTVEIKGRVPLNGGGTATLTPFLTPGTPCGKALNVQVKPVVSPNAKPKKPESGTEAPTAENRTLQAGSVVIVKGAKTLTLTVTELTHPETGWLMDLSQISLTRTGDAPASGKLP